MLISGNILPKKLYSWCLLINTCRYKATMNETLLKSVKACIPTLDGGKHKGQAGRIGIVGGSLEYTGAPYFAGISALKVGADLVHIFCASPAAGVIKSYSPELIVHPLLDHPNATTQISPWLDRLHALVIGPGLGRETETFNVVTELINIVKEKKIPLVIDADGLFLVTNKPEVIKDFSSPVILTPNKIEFERLCNSLGGASKLRTLGENVTVFKKGEEDQVYSSVPEAEWKSNVYGSNRRCGGQGDVLSGSIATFLNWTLSNKDKIEIGSAVDKTRAAASLACYSASILVRKCNEKAFKVKGRSMLAGDMVEYIHESFEELYGQ
ncbi:ATP-dependent (S)-NAD(P)H-hydrate dehydratase [Leguminivora glycinivorella]|uniref:ATP-dependent (S)-NAD(P)H-hydrate dehydratase n=1 Tax=Leguminivora glycinivorella TaxID=1035111 RepID=UPI00200F81F8|nr:ATP-dependent (S)-NAD(P)H-hydrate dehydratase [Leguminivora glycinivorella]XP_048007547.1 ATP-dependent (S)-NAD(P)H-hydrate dehydratase [Leguminivora glycinivorella]